MAIDERHDSANSIEGWIGKAFFTLQLFQPLLYFQRFYTKCNPVAPTWERPVLKHPPVTEDCGVRLGID